MTALRCAALASGLQIRRGQKIVHVRIVLGAILEYYTNIDFRPDDISYPPVQPV
jgi:hypothetical protein